MRSKAHDWVCAERDLRGAQSRRLLAIVSAVALSCLSGCSAMFADNCSVSKQIAEKDGGPACAIASHTRSAMYSGDDFPRLWSGDEARTTANVDALAFNAGPQLRSGGPSPRGYLGSLRVEIPVSKQVTESDVLDLRRVSGPHFDPEEKVAVNFKDATIDFFLQQMLTGALGVPYVAAKDLGGSITFRTEEPLPKGQVLQVVRDILGRQGLVMKNLDGVYHVDKAESIAGAEAAAKFGREGDQSTRMVAVPRGNAAEIVQIVRGLVPEDVTLIAVDRGEIVVKATSPTDLASISDLISSLASRAVGDDSVAIIPLTQAGPTRIAAQLDAFYKDRLGGKGGESVTIIPLEAQNALLIGARDKGIMAGVRKLVAQLDRNTGDEMTVRIIPLTNLQAKETAETITAILGIKSAQTATGGEPLAGAAETRTADGSAGRTGNPAFQSVTSSSAGFRNPTSSASAGAITPPSGNWPYGSLNGANETERPIRPASARPEGGLRDGGGVGAALSDTANVRIEPDVRTNTLLVYSNFAIFKRVQEIIKTLDVPQSQVVIEATIAEVTLTDDLQYGVQAYLTGNGLALRNSVGNSPVDPGANGGFAGIGFTVGNMKADLLLHALQTVTTVKVISSPYLTVLDKRTARLVVGDQIPFAESSQTSNNAGTTTITENIQTKDTGVVFEVTPTINANNSVTLTIDQQISTPAPDAFEGNKTPVIATRQVKSDVLVQSGRTFVLGGLIQERLDRNEVGLPPLRSVPLLGELFKPSTTDRGTRKELLVLITPRVSRQSGDIERITRLLRDQTHVH